MSKTILDHVSAALSNEDFGGSFRQTNIRAGENVINQLENRYFQLRETRPSNGGEPGVRISPKGNFLGTQARKDGGFGKLTMLLNVKAHLDTYFTENSLSDNWSLAYSDAGQGGRGNYPTIYVNSESSADRSLNMADLIRRARDLGMEAEQIIELSGSISKLAAAVMLGEAEKAPAKTETVTESAPANGDEDVPF